MSTDKKCYECFIVNNDNVQHCYFLQNNQGECPYKSANGWIEDIFICMFCGFKFGVKNCGDEFMVCEK